MKLARTTTEAEYRKALGLPPRQIDRIEAELQLLPHVDGDKRLARRAMRKRAVDARQAKDAADAIGELPGPKDSVHMLIAGKFALWDFVPAAISMGGDVEWLTIATLGFSNRNITQLCDLIDAKKINRARMLCSHYFAGTSKPIYDFAVAEFKARPARMEFMSIRTHAKILLLAFADGRRLTLESSANLRSCKNIEQASAFGDPMLYDFHSEWISELFAKAGL